ncbi:MAG TPA: CusA/CzcA family heavy metal efflux RND transporter, partial [Phenylobacterium sp.]
MIDRLLALAVRRRFAVIFIFALLALGGAVSLSRLPIDAVPDITDKQVQINTVAPSLSPLETERLVSFPVESALAGIPGLESTRSISRSGFSQVTAVFKEHVDIYFARQQVAERLNQVRGSLPTGVAPEMGAVTTGLGEVLLWSIDYKPFDRHQAKAAGSPGWQPDGTFLTPEGDRLGDPVTLGGYLRSVQEWIIKPQIRAVNGVAGIDTIGGYEKQYVVQPDPAKLTAYGISYSDIVVALAAANVSVGANYIPRAGEAFLVRTDARVRALEDIARASVVSRHGVPVLVRDVASVTLGGDLRTGAASEDGREVVVGTVQMLAGANSRTVAVAARERLQAVAKTLPPGLRVRVVYDRSRLVDATIQTVGKNLGEGAIFVVAVLFLLLGNFRAALIATLVIPLAMLMTAIGMHRLGVSGNLMSLGALDFGLIVDGAVIIVENCLRRLAHRQQAVERVLSLPERLEEVVAASREMIQPTLYGQAIILLVYAPLLTFQGVEGKMFAPMALTVMLALASALVISLTLVPAMAALLVRGRVAEKDVRVIAAAKRGYAPALTWALERPYAVISAGVATFLVAAAMFLGLGREFIPQLDEQDLALEGRRLPSISLVEAQKAQADMERLILREPEVATVFSKIGTSEAANDPMPPNSADTFVIMKPRREWPDPHLSKADLIERFDRMLGVRVGETQEVSQPIQMRFNELIAGVKG